MWCTHRGVKILVLAKKIFFLKIYSYLIELFTHKRISPDCPFKGTQRLVKNSILTQRCTFWLCGVMPTAELDSAEEAHRRAWLLGVMRTAEFFWELFITWPGPHPCGVFLLKKWWKSCYTVPLIYVFCFPHQSCGCEYSVRTFTAAYLWSCTEVQYKLF